MAKNKESGKKWLQRKPKIKAKSNQIRESIFGKQGLNEKTQQNSKISAK